MPDVPQTSAGGLYPNNDCGEEDAVSLAARFSYVPGVVQFTVREAEIWESNHGADPSRGTPITTLAALMTAYGMGSTVNSQVLDAAFGRGHYCIPLVWASTQGIPVPAGTAGAVGHYVVYLGDGWYRNPATGTLTNTPALGPAYRGQCVEINLDAWGSPTEDEENMLLVRNTATGHVYLLTGARAVPIHDPTQEQAFKNAGVKEAALSSLQYTATLAAYGIANAT